MCGIAGLFWTGVDNKEETIQRMAAALTHRGPDSSGTWSDERIGLTLIHRRLAILDLSHDGHQPMRSATGRYTISFNGEIYNFSELKNELVRIGAVFMGTSDTEVLLACIESWGLKTALTRLEGMFAFALWDAKENTLTLARDRLGEKPLYYGWIAGGLSFASELSALKLRFETFPSISQKALESYLQFGRVPSPYSIYEGVYKLPAGSWIEFKSEHFRTVPSNFSPSPEHGEHHPIRYWDARAIALAANSEPRVESLAEAVEGVEKRLSRAVSQQMVADVPLGAFLSGGIDSSLIVALMQEQSSSPLNTFTIGFSDGNYNEATFARQVSQHLGTNHHELYVSATDALEVIPRIPTICDEPLADQSIVPTYLLCALARKRVTVSLSGDGADEVFGGYERHIFAPKLERLITSVPFAIRKLGALGLGIINPDEINRLAMLLSIHKKGLLGVKNPGSKISKLKAIFSARTSDDLYRASSSHWINPREILQRSNPIAGFPNLSGPILKLNSSVERSMLLDLLHYLPDTILMKLDRSAMAVSLESRAPFLNHTLIEYVFSLSPTLKCRGNIGKVILRELLASRVPRQLWDRPKSGFSMPIAEWLRTDLKSWAADLLEGETFTSSAYFNVPVIRRIWRQHRDGKIDAHNRLWNILMFESWRRHQVH